MPKKRILTTVEKLYLSDNRAQGAAKLFELTEIPEDIIREYLGTLPKQSLLSVHKSGAVSMTQAQSEEDDKIVLPQNTEWTKFKVDPDKPAR